MPDKYYAEIRQRLARSLRHIRAELNLTQESAAQAIGIATRHFQKLEAGELNVTLRTMCRIAEAFQIEISELLLDDKKEE